MPVHERGDTLASRLQNFARQTPDAIAIEDGGTRVTFAELDAEASAIARQLAVPGDGQPGRVGLFFGNRLASAKAMVGVARSGHAFVPLDPDDPDERLRFMLDDSVPLAILTEASLSVRAHALAHRACKVIDIDGIANGEAGAPFAAGRADAIAQMLYTSGSTGHPKGVPQTHASQLHFVDAYALETGIGAGDRIALLHSLRFAAGVFAVFRSIGLGATLCVYDLKRDGVAGLADWLDRERITMLHAFPAVFREMAARLPPQRILAHLKVVSLGGESLFASDFALFRGHTAPHCKLVHQLAASEMAGMTRNVMRHDAAPAAGAVISVGRAVPGVRIEIRREDGSAARAGEAGEVIACSRHLTPGYWNRPQLNAERFFADPFADPGDTTARCYRTGDQGRLDTDGQLHFLGREASRVKIRGHTVDLAEIEAALVAWPHASGVAAAAEGDAAELGSMRLCAYLEPRDGAPREPGAVRRFLAEKLPPHMMPADVRYVKALPRTTGGKLDRRLLAEAERLPADRRIVAPPRDALEAAIAHVFVELLKVDGAGPDDDFFVLGGDSLMLADLQSRIEATFGVHVGEMSRGATVAGIATSIRSIRAASPR